MHASIPVAWKLSNCQRRISLVEVGYLDQPMIRPREAIVPKYPLLTDENLIERALRADHVAYRELVDRYKDAGYRLALQILRHPSDAEDALQEAFTKAYVYLDSYSNTFRFYTWFSTIVRNVSLSHLKARDWMISPLAEDTALPVRSLLQESPELAALASSRAEIVRAAVDQLPERYRRVLVLRYWHDLTYEEIATVTQQSLGAVKTQIHRAKAQLCDRLIVREPSWALD
jgi:RNA polymerase sigma-70 factor, ECF subfamily